MDVQEKTENWFKTKTPDEVRWLDEALFNFNQKFLNIEKYNEIMSEINSEIILFLSNQINQKEFSDRVERDSYFYKLDKQTKDQILKNSNELVENFKKLSPTEVTTNSFIEQKLVNPITTKPEQGKFIEQKEGSIKKIDPYREAVEE